MITKKQKQDVFEYKITPRHLVLCIFFIFFAGGLLTIGEYPAWSSDDPYDLMPSFMRPDPRIWKGTITVTRTGKGDETVDKSSNGNIKYSTYTRNVEENMTLEVCGPAQALYVHKMTHTLRDHTERHSKKAEARTNCGMPEQAKDHSPLYQLKHYKPIIVSPGNSSDNKSEKTITLYTDKDAAPMHKHAGAKIQRMPDNKYIITAVHEWHTSTTANTVLREIDVCEGGTRTVKSQYRTCPLGQKGSIRSYDSKEGSSTTVVTMPPVPHKFGFGTSHTGDLNNDVISGTYNSEMDQGLYKEKTTATWELEAHDPCPDVFNALGLALVAAQAYANQDIRNFADNVAEYESLITDRISKIFTGKPLPRQPGDQGNPVDFVMNVDRENCTISQKGREAFEEHLKKECQHPIIFETALLHEKQHVRQCMDDNHDPKFNSDTATKASVQAKGQAEVSAYLAEAKKLLGWLRTHCSDKNLDLAGAEARLKAIEAMNAGW